MNDVAELNQISGCIPLGAKYMAMNVTPIDQIDNVLTDWFQWSVGYEPVAGYRESDASCRDFQISNQWMTYSDLSEQVDRNILAETGKAVEPIVMALDGKHRIAVMTAVRNFHAGVRTFQNPRSPETQDADYAAAKEIMRPALIANGLISGKQRSP